MYPKHCMILPIAYTLRYLVKCLSLQKHGFAKCAVINMQWNAFQKMCFESVRIYFVENGKEVLAISSTWASPNPLDKKKKTASIRGVWTCCGCYRPPTSEIFYYALECVRCWMENCTQRILPQSKTNVVESRFSRALFFLRKKCNYFSLG